MQCPPPHTRAQATQFYNEALRHSEAHTGSMLALAKLHLANGDVDGCQQQCVLLLKHYPNNEEAAIMLAELMFHKVGEGGGGDTMAGWLA